MALVHQRPPSTLEAERVRAEAYGVAVRPGAGTGSNGSWPMRLLDRRRVLIHARNQLAVGHDLLTTRAHDLDISPEWQFASYNEHARQCADTARSDLVVMSRHSAHRLLPGWTWYPLCEPTTTLETYVVRQREARTVVEQVYDAIVAGSRASENRSTG